MGLVGAFALALPAALVGDFWRVLWIADAAAHDTDRAEDLLSAPRGQIAARQPTTESPPPSPRPRREPRRWRQPPAGLYAVRGLLCRGWLDHGHANGLVALHNKVEVLHADFAARHLVEGLLAQLLAAVCGLLADGGLRLRGGPVLLGHGVSFRNRVCGCRSISGVLVGALSGWRRRIHAHDKVEAAGHLVQRLVRDCCILGRGRRVLRLPLALLLLG